MAGSDLQVAAVALAGPAAPPPVQVPAGVSDSGAFAEALRAAGATAPVSTPAAASSAPVTTPAAASSGAPEEFGLARALGVISALRAAPPPAAGAVTSNGPAAVVVSSPTGVATTPVGAPDAGARRVALATAELGVTEAPAGSNDSPRIAQYRTAVPGGGVGRWCAYFVSWVARQAGTPLGPNGQGFAAVEGVRGWLRREGRLTEGPAAVGRPGDLVFFDGNRDGTWDHIGLVEAVLPDGRVQTIEGNSSDSVRRRVRDRSEIVAFGTLG